MANRVLRIGGASGFWGDAAQAPPQLLNVAGLYYIGAAAADCGRAGSGEVKTYRMD